jgi:predicted component of type VI protein secretion system
MFLQRHFLNRSTTELEDIEQNLSFVFHSKSGAGYDFQGLGLPDMHFRTAEVAVNTLKEVVPALVTRHEPRLEVVAVDDDFDDDGRPFVTVSCVQRSTGVPVDIVIDGSSSSVRFKLRADDR